MLSIQSENFLKNERVLITGAAGSIGSALAKRVALQKPRKLLLFDNNESDLFNLCEEVKIAKPIIGSIRDEKWIDQIFKTYKPTIILHTAAYKHVYMLERFPLEGIKTNIEGLLNVIKSAISHKVNKFVFVSTDKAVNPTSIMGQTKKIGEKLCLFLNNLSSTKFIIVRFGNVLASRGSVVEIFKKQIKESKPLTVTDRKMKRFTMGIYEAARLVLEATRLGKGGEKFIFDMGEQMYIEDLAKLMIKLSGKDLPICYTGIKKGEKLSEELFTSSERLKAKKINNLYVI